MASEGSRPFRRRWLVAGAVVVLLLVVGWQVVELTADVDRYRPQVEAEVARITGHPVSIARLDLAWRPIPCLSAIDVAVGEGDLQVTADRVDVFPALLPLLGRRIEIPDVSLDTLVLTLPPEPDALRRAWTELDARITEAFAGDGDDADEPSAWEVEVARVEADDAVVRFGEGGDPFLQVTAGATGVTSDTLALSIIARLPLVGGEIEGELFVPLAGDTPDDTLRGHFDFLATHPGPLMGLPSFLDVVWSGRVEITQPGGGPVRIELAGDFAPSHDDAVAGTIAGHALLSSDAPATAALDVSGEGITLHADYDARHETPLHVRDLTLTGLALERSLGVASEGRLAPGADARIEAHDLDVAIGPEGWPRVEAGRAALRGIRVMGEEAAIAEDVRAEARFEKGTIVLEEASGGPLTLRGRITPGEAWSRYDLALSGRLRLEDAWLHAAGVPEEVRDVRGVLQIDEIAGRLPAEEDGEPLRVRAHLESGALRVATADAEDAISVSRLALTSQDRRIVLEARARSQRIGDVSLDTTLDPAERRARGNLAIDPTQLASYLSDPETRESVAPLLESIGAGRIGFQLDPVETDATGGKSAEGVYRLLLERVASPRILATLDLHTEGDGDMLGNLDLDVELPGAGLRGVLPDDARTSGRATLRLVRTASAGTFVVDVDLTPFGFATGHFVEKKPGETLALHLEGGVTKGEKASDAGGSWTPRRLEVRAAGSALPLGLRDGGVVAPELDVDLADWRFLLTDGARVSGRVYGSIDTPASRTSLTLDRAALRFTEDIGLDAIDGVVALEGDDWSVRGLYLRGATSDATLDASLAGGRFEGVLRGHNLDLDFVRALVGEIEAFQSDEPDPEPTPIAGELKIALDRLGFGRSEAKRVRARVALENGNVAVRDLAFETYEGRVAGTADILAGEPSTLKLDLDFAGVTGRFLDDAFFDPPREIQGTFDAKLRFDAPMHDDPKAMLAAGHGALDIRGRKGTLGKLGFATKLIAVLRSTETLRAKLPSLRDEGLVFDDLILEVALENGLGTVKKLDLDSHAYAIDATGTLDFRTEKSRLPIEMNLIKGLSGAVSWIPVAGSALRILNVRLTATGSPYDLQVGVAGVRDQLLGAGRAGVGAVIGDATQALRVLRGGGEEPAPAPPDPDGGAEMSEEPDVRDLAEPPASEEVTPADVAPTDPGPEAEASEPAGESDEPDPTPGAAL